MTPDRGQCMPLPVGSAQVHCVHSVVFDSVSKRFRHRPALGNFIGRETRGETRALDSVSFEVPTGQVLALLGPNGSGKTTALKLMSTLLLADSGHVLVHGVNARADSDRVRRHVGYAVASDRSFFPRLSARENLDFFAALDNVPRNTRPQQVEAMLDQVGLWSAADTLIMKFSSGMVQRLAIARALIKRPSLLLLDEPTRSLDPVSAAQVQQLIRDLAAQGSTVVLASHSLPEAASLADWIAILDHGRLVGYRPRTVVQELHAYYLDCIGETASEELALTAS